VEIEKQEKDLVFHTYIKEVFGLKDPPKIKVLDFGCGEGEKVESFLALGYEAYGCDITSDWLENSSVPSEKFKTISLEPYRLPYGDNSFDVVFSSSVFEHAKNKMQCFQEIHRVLKVGGHSMHAFPSKWRLPYEPHIYVPLVNYLWPNSPRWWLAIWALLGVRNEFQDGKTWKEVVDLNHRFCQEGISYWTNGKYRRLSLKVFGNFISPMQFYLKNSDGGSARLFQKLPFKPACATIFGYLREYFIVSQKHL
jgi:SAM-dependent methyltransferase